MNNNEMLCLQCLSKGKVKNYVPGHFALELLLWLMITMPGLIYTIWRKAASYKGCSACGSKNLVPLDSPIAKKMLAA